MGTNKPLASNSGNPAVGGKRAKILVADDHAADRDYLCALLDASGYDVVLAADGAEALALARTVKPQLLITDLLMPKLDGYELIRCLRADPATASIRIVIWSATFRQGEARALAKRLGVSHFLQKPVPPQKMLSMIEEVLQGPEPAFRESDPKEVEASYRTLLNDALYRKTEALEREIAKCAHVETELRESSARFGSIIASAMDAIISIDQDQRIVIFNAAAEAMFGCSAAEAKGTPLARLIPEKLRNLHARHVEQFFRSGGTSRKMGRLLPLLGLRANGTEFPIEASISKSSVGDSVLASVIVRDISERVEYEERIREAAQHDALTKLPNRALIYEQATRLLASARRRAELSAFLYVDLDRFKPINDTYGHDAGDAMLVEVARRLTACVRSEDMVGRLGGDEFLVLLPHIATEKDASKVALHILALLRKPYYVPGNELPLKMTPSIGISLFPQDGASVDELVKRADTAMYQAKRAGRNDFQFFRREWRAAAEKALRLESRLHDGLESREFELHFQPILDLASGEITAAEALVRWPAMQVGPEDFIPVAEAAGFMSSLGTWIMREACSQRQGWRRQSGLEQISVAVNVSPAQFRKENFVETVAQALDDAGLEATELKVEITESLAMQNESDAIRILNSLRRMGIRVALDDFGTGYSSLSHLTRLPVDILKLDQSFVRNLGRDANAATVADSILALAKSLGLQVVAEGIESEEALAFLTERNCSQGQGFHFSAPLPAAQFVDWCHRHAI